MRKNLLAVLLAAFLIAVSVTGCKQYYIPVPIPGEDGGPQAFTVRTFSELRDTVQKATDGDSIFMENVSVDLASDSLPIRISDDISLSGSILVANDTSIATNAVSERDNSVYETRTAGNAVVFEIADTASISINGLSVTIRASAVSSVRSIMSVNRGSISVTSMTVVSDTSSVIAVELGSLASSSSITGSLAGLNVSVVAENDNAYEIADKIASSAGASVDVGGNAFAVYNPDLNSGYDTLDAAMTAAESGDTIRLASDLVVDSIYFLRDKDVTLDLNGKTITESDTLNYAGGLIYVRGGGHLTIMDSSESKTGAIDAYTERMDANNQYYAVYAAISIFAEEGTTAELTILGGSFRGSYYAIVGNGTAKEGNNTIITISDGIFESEDGPSVYHPQRGTLTITGGTFIGADSAIEIRSGNLDISGGSFTALRSPSSVTSNGNGTTSSGSAIAIAQHTTKFPIDVDIRGGIFNGYSAVYESNPQQNPQESISQISLDITGGAFNSTNNGTQVVYSEDLTGFISGGTYSIAPDEKYIASGYSAVQTGTDWIIR